MHAEIEVSTCPPLSSLPSTPTTSPSQMRVNSSPPTTSPANNLAALDSPEETTDSSETEDPVCLVISQGMYSYHLD
jgi:hypothetical protein